MRILLIIVLSGLELLLNAQTNGYQLPVVVFRDGETLTYELSYGPITGGQVTGTVKKAGYPYAGLYHAMIVAKTTGIADVLYKILDVYESEFDPRTGLPVQAIRNVQEGSYRQYIEAKYDREKNIIHSSLSGIHKVPMYTHDITSAFYYFRSMDYSRMKPGDMIVIQTYFGDEVFALKIRYRGKEVIKTGLGRIACIKFSPVTEVGRAFATEDDMHMWLSDDANHVPIRVKLDLRVGSIKCDLVSYSNLLTDLRRVK